MAESVAEAHRQFAAKVAAHLTYVFTVQGYPRGTGKEARAVLLAIRGDLHLLHRAVLGSHPDTTALAEAIEGIHG